MENSKSLCYFKQLLLIREQMYESKVKMPPKVCSEAKSDGNDCVGDPLI